MPETKDDTHRRIATFLPGAIAAALESYQHFMAEQGSSPPTEEEPTSAKEFKDHHDACKVAIAHIELLLKLAKTVSQECTEGMDEAERTVFQDMMAKAQAEIDARGSK